MKKNNKFNPPIILKKMTKVSHINKVYYVKTKNDFVQFRPCLKPISLI